MWLSQQVWARQRWVLRLWALQPPRQQPRKAKLVMGATMGPRAELIGQC